MPPKAELTTLDLYRQFALVYSRQEECEFWFRVPTEDIRRHHSHDNDSCTGKVTVWPMRSSNGHAYCEAQGYCVAELPTYMEEGDCHGLGWVPICDMATLARESRVSSMSKDHGGGWAISFYVGELYRYTVEVPDDDPELALLQAALKWQESTAGGAEPRGAP